jgi:hypothetical protein
MRFRSLRRLGISILLAAVALLAGSCAHEPSAASPHAEDASPMIGVVPQRELEPGEAARMRAAGIDSVRIWLSWAAVEASRGTEDWSQSDGSIADLASAGLTPLPYIFGSPTWVARGEGTACPRTGCAAYPPRSAEMRDELARFAAAAVARYGPDGSFWTDHPEVPYHPVGTWQVWNEPNLLSYYLPRIDAAAYGRLFRDVARAIHDEDPEAEVVIGGLSGSRTNPRRESLTSFLRRFYRVREVASAVDGIAIHPYHPRPEGVYEQIAAARKVARAHDPAFSLWITEIGWASRGGPRWSLVTNRRGQAHLLGTVFGELLRRAAALDLRGIYWYAWRDTTREESVCGWCAAAGLIDAQGRGKPAFGRLRQIAARG